MIFSTLNAITVTGLKHGSTQLYYTAHKALGVPYQFGNKLEFVRFFDYKKLFTLLESKVYGDDLLKEMNFTLNNSTFNKINFVNDFANDLGKPLILFIRDPLKAAQSSIIEDLMMFLNKYAGYLSGKSGNVRQLFLDTRSSEIQKTYLERYPYVEDLFFELNEYAVDYEKNTTSTLFEHTEYEHLNYIYNILAFYSIKSNNNVFDSILLLDIDNKYDTPTLDRLDSDNILVKNYPREEGHTTSKLVKLLPNFLEKIPSLNVIYNKRLYKEQAMYSFIMSNYADKMFNLEKYEKITDMYQTKFKELESSL